ncbi:peptidase C39 family protein [Streptomyces sp. NBC_01789]|uniref:peptidase C39 family protein n=1 Tax=Streptomyces sp. NBC_01789 TaxID=2975941 RepID=UPI0022576B4A|nr:peptidase C39 family protein [Streptomyces sp. NBC_01789]MCX4447098.1 peptidase C39 family protein [Streptomyces sp. NBC_01789]
MSSQQQGSVNGVVVPYEPGTAPSRLADPEVAERWRAVDRTAHAPHLVAVPGDGGDWVGAALVTARPDTAYLKIVDAVGDVPAVVAAVVAHARARGLVQLKWEGWTVTPEEAAAAGFTALEPPLSESEGAAGPATGYVRWLKDDGATASGYGGVTASGYDGVTAPAYDGVTAHPYDGVTAPAYDAVTAPPYYGQTTHFSCGAVTALVAQVHAGVLPREALDRRAELTLWRDATNFMACDPVGLGVALRRSRPSSEVTVHLDTDRPVMLDHLPPGDQEWRALLQQVSRTDAERAGVPVDPGHLPLSAVRDAIGRREHVLLLLSLAAMQGFDVPHWVLCHGVVPGAVVIDDPWANGATGDTWVDAHLLPVPDASLDAMSTMEPGGFRGAVTMRSAHE